MRHPLICVPSIPPLEPYLTERRAQTDDYGAQVAFAAMLFEREEYYTALYGPYGQYGEEPPPAHESAWQPFAATKKARQIRRTLWSLSGDAPPGALPHDLFGLKPEALAGLRAVVRERKAHLMGMLIAARFSIDLCRYRDALAVANVAERLSPNDPVPAAYGYGALVHLVEEGPEPVTAAKAAERRLRRLLGASWMKGASRATEDHALTMRRHAWRLRTEREGSEFTRFLTTEKEFCEAERERAMASIDPTGVPKEFRHLLPLARRYGVGDDACRGEFVRRAPKRDRVALVRQAEPHLEAIQRWVDTFKPGALPSEAEAFYWLLEAVEEARPLGDRAG